MVPVPIVALRLSLLSGLLLLALPLLASPILSANAGPPTDARAGSKLMVMHESRSVNNSPQTMPTVISASTPINKPTNQLRFDALTATSPLTTTPIEDSPTTTQTQTAIATSTPSPTYTATSTNTSTATPTTPTATLTRTPIPACGLAWRMVPNPDRGTYLNNLYGVAAVAATNVWAVGRYTDGGESQTQIKHWDGIQWRVVPSPNLAARNSSLQGVSALAANDVWAVGNGTDESGTLHTLVEHWNGTQWSIVPSPGYGTLYGVAAIAANDVWAVGSFSANSEYSLTMHWNGTQWSAVSTPGFIDQGYTLYSVAAVSANDVWAVGAYTSSSSWPLIMHWNGTQWNRVNIPQLGGNGLLYGVTTVSTNDVWAAGYFYNFGFPLRTLTVHWDGNMWTVVPSPNIESAYNSLNAITAISHDDVWAVGKVIDTASGHWQPLALHWNGSVWSIIPSPNGGIDSAMHSVAAAGADNIWAVGDVNNNSSPYPALIEQYSDPCARMMVGHMIWQGPPAQPSARQQLPFTVTLKLGSTELNYPNQTTDARGYFSISVASLVTGTYNWRIKGARYLANSGLATLTDDALVSLEAGLMKSGDANNDNLVTVVDINILRRTFSLCIGDPSYDGRADFDNSNCVSITDFNLMRGNFGLGGTPPINPGGP